MYAGTTLKVFVYDGSPIPEESAPVYLAVAADGHTFEVKDWAYGRKDAIDVKKISLSEALKLLESAQHSAERNLSTAQKRIEDCRKVRQALQKNLPS